MNFDDSSRYRGPHESPGFLCWRLFHEWKRTVTDALETHGITQLQFSLMACIAWLKHVDPTAEVGQVDVAQLSGVGEMQVSLVARTLADKKLLDRPRSRTDARRRVLELTADGERVLSQALPVVEQADQDYFSRSDGPTTLQTFLDTAQRYR